MNGLYECTVMHRRLIPKSHGFRYRVFMFCVDLDDLPRLGKSLFGFSHNRFNLFSINDEDHVRASGTGSIRESLCEWLAHQGSPCPADARIQLVTFPRVLGYGFNPVSFFYISSPEGKPLAAVAEVVNTFREMKLYPMNHLGTDQVWHSRVAKNFYVSPFSDPGDEFDFKIGLPGKSLKIHIDNYAVGERSLVSSVIGKQRALTSARLWIFSLKYPLLSLKIMVGIHWQALILWLRRIPFFRKTARLDSQVDVMRPHSSLSKHIP